MGEAGSQADLEGRADSGLQGLIPQQEGSLGGAGKQLPSPVIPSACRPRRSRGVWSLRPLSLSLSPSNNSLAARVSAFQALSDPLVMERQFLA